MNLLGEVVRRFVAQQTDRGNRRIVAAYLDPINFKNIGDGHTIANQVIRMFHFARVMSIGAKSRFHSLTP